MAMNHGTLRWYVNDETKPGGYRMEEIAPGDLERAAEVANMLWQENIKSVSHRYPNESSATLPGPIGGSFVIEPHHIKPYRVRVEVVQVLKACHCYAYQSCEHDGWKTSDAKAFIDALESQAVRKLPGYDEAEWGAPEHMAA